MHYLLTADGEPAPCDNIIVWAIWMESAAHDNERTVARDVLPDGREVSTVFLGLDHNFSGAGDPVLWETMVFTRNADGELQGDDMQRYTSRAAALEGHAAMIDALMRGRHATP
jgi:hypothetical protein